MSYTFQFELPEDEMGELMTQLASQEFAVLLVKPGKMRVLRPEEWVQVAEDPGAASEQR